MASRALYAEQSFEIVGDVLGADPLDGDGYGGAWIDLEKMPLDDLGAMVSRILSRPESTVILTLPEIGQSRNCNIEFGLIDGGMGAFVACLCAMRDPHLRDKRVWDCSRR